MPDMETGNWKLETGNWKLHYFHEITSTMDIAETLAKKGCPEFTVIIAGCQKAGRGRLEKSLDFFERGTLVYHCAQTANTELSGLQS